MNFPKFDDYIKITESLDTEVFRFGIWKNRNINHINEDGGLDNANQLAVRQQVASMSDDESLAKAEKIIQMCKIKIVNHFEWFKPYYDIMPPIPKHGAGSRGADGIGTMSTSGTAIYYDPRFVVLTYEQAKSDFNMSPDQKKKGALSANLDGSQWYSDYACFVVLHEIMHNSLKHFLRMRTDIISDYVNLEEIHYLWNLAQDYEINRILKTESYAAISIFPGGVDLEEGPYKVPDEELEFFRVSTSDRIFWRLLKNLEDTRRKKAEEQEEDTDEDGEGQDGEGQEDEGQGEGQEGEGQEGDGEDGEGEVKLKPGDIIQDHETGEYGRVTSVNGEDVEWTPITREEAIKEIYGS